MVSHFTQFCCKIYFLEFYAILWRKGKCPTSISSKRLGGICPVAGKKKKEEHLAREIIYWNTLQYSCWNTLQYSFFQQCHLSPIFWTCFLNLCLTIAVKMCDFPTLCDLPTFSQGTETNLDSWKFCMFLRTRGTGGDNTQLFLVTMLIECRRHY